MEAPRTSLWSRLVVFYSINKPDQLNPEVSGRNAHVQPENALLVHTTLFVDRSYSYSIPAGINTRTPLPGTIERHNEYTAVACGHQFCWIGSSLQSLLPIKNHMLVV